MDNKDEIRQRIGQQRKLLEPDVVEASSRRIVKKLFSMEAFLSASTVALYLSAGNEVKLEELFLRCWKLGKRTMVPVLNTKKKAYEMAFRTRETILRTGRYGIREPENPEPGTLEEIDLIVVPGIAFDHKGNRLGRGGGHYDRLLNGFSGCSMGVAYDFQLVETLPVEAHDVPLDGVVTESCFIKV